MKWDKEKNVFILTREELSVLEDVVTSLKVVSKDYNGILIDLKQELENANTVLSTLPEHWWAESKLLEEDRKRSVTWSERALSITQEHGFNRLKIRKELDNDNTFFVKSSVDKTEFIFYIKRDAKSKEKKICCRWVASE